MITNVLPHSLWFTMYKLHVGLCRRSTCVDLLVDQLCDSVRHMRPWREYVWFSVGNVKFVETVEIWRVWNFGIYQQKIKTHIPSE